MNSISIFHIELIEVLVKISMINKLISLLFSMEKRIIYAIVEVDLSKWPMDDVNETWTNTFTIHARNYYQSKMKFF